MHIYSTMSQWGALYTFKEEIHFRKKKLGAQKLLFQISLFLALSYAHAFSMARINTIVCLGGRRYLRLPDPLKHRL